MFVHFDTTVSRGQKGRSVCKISRFYNSQTFTSEVTSAGSPFTAQNYHSHFHSHLTLQILQGKVATHKGDVEFSDTDGQKSYRGNLWERKTFENRSTSATNDQKTSHFLPRCIIMDDSNYVTACRALTLLAGRQEGHLACRLFVLFVCLGFNGTFSTNRLHRAITVGKYIT